MKGCKEMKRTIVISFLTVLLLSFCGCSSSTSKEPEEVIIPDHQIYIDIDFEENLFLATYDVEVYIDDIGIGTIKHGKNLTYLTSVKEGPHTVIFYKATDNGVSSKKQIKVLDDTTYRFLIHSNRSSIDIKEYEESSGIIGNELSMINVVGLNFAEAKKQLESAGFVNINYKTTNGDIIWNDGAWLVLSQNLDSGALVDKNAEIILTCEKPQTPEPTSKPASSSTPTTGSEAASASVDSDDAGKTGTAYYHSSTQTDIAKKGNTGVFAYCTIGGPYEIYIIIDFDEGYIYRFLSNDDSCERVKIDYADSGDSLNQVIIVTYHDGNTIWQEGYHFKWQHQPDHLINEDYNHFETDFYSTDLDEALKIRDTKHIKDY